MMREHGSPKKYEHIMFGHNYRMEGIQGAVLGVKMKYINKWNTLLFKVEHYMTRSSILE